MNGVRVDGLDGIKTGTITMNARQRNEYNSSMPTIKDGDPRADPQLQENPNIPLAVMGEKVRGGCLLSRHFLPRPKVLRRQGLSTQISSVILPGHVKQKSWDMCQPQPGAQPIAGERHSIERGTPGLCPGPQACMLSDLARLVEGTEQPGEEGAERKEKPSAALSLPSQLIRGTTGTREAGPGSRRSDCQGHNCWHQPRLEGAWR